MLIFGNRVQAFDGNLELSENVPKTINCSGREPILKPLFYFGAICYPLEHECRILFLCISLRKVVNYGLAAVKSAPALIPLAQLFTQTEACN